MKKMVLIFFTLFFVISCGDNQKNEMPKPKIKKLRPLILVGYADKLYTSDTKKASLIWGTFFNKMGQIKHIISGPEFWGASYDIKANQSFMYMAAKEVSKVEELPNGFTSLSIPEKTYAIFKHKGLMKEFNKTYRKVINEWLPQSEYIQDGNILELYNEEFKMNSKDSVMYIYVPVVKK